MAVSSRRISLIIMLIFLLFAILGAIFLKNQSQEKAFYEQGRRFTWCDSKIHEYKYHGQILPEECKEKMEEK